MNAPTRRGAVCRLMVLGLLISAGVGCPPKTPCGPNAEFTAQPLSGPAPLVVQFTDTSLPGDKPISAWNWSFGDGQFSTERNPSHTYTTPGRFSVSLEVTTEIRKDQETKEQYIVVTDSGGGEIEGTVAPLPPKHLNLAFMSYHDPSSSNYLSKCTVCHRDRSQDLAASGTLLAAHSVMPFFGEGDARCAECHFAGVDFLWESDKLLRAETFQRAGCAVAPCHGSTSTKPFYVGHK